MRLRLALTLVVAVAAALAAFVLGVRTGRSGAVNQSLTTRHYAVLLRGGFVIYGQVEDRNRGGFLVLRDAYASSTTREKGALQTALALRAGEMHAPARTYVNNQRVLSIEPVNAASPIGKAIGATR